MRRAHQGLVAAAFVGLSVAVAAEPPKPLPIEFFAKPAKFKSMVLSPDGKHLAFTFEEGNNETKLGVADTQLKKISAVFEFGDDYHVGEQFWASDERLVMDVWKSTGYLDGRRQGRKSFSAGYDGSNRRELSSGNYFSRLIDPLQTDPENVLIARYYPNSDRSMKLHRTNIVNGKSDFFRGAPAPREGSRIVDVGLDTQDRIRVAVELDDGKEEYDDRDDSYRFHFRPVDGEWQEIAIDAQRQPAEYWKLGFGPDDRIFYFLSNFDQAESDTLGVFGFDFDTGEIRLVFRHPDVDVESAIRGPSGEVLGVSYSPGYPAHEYFYPEHPLVQRIRSIEAAFPGQNVSVNSYSKDGKRASVVVRSDRNPGEFYLFDGGKLKFLAATRPDADPARLGTQEAFTMTARDGVKLYGLITLPPGREASELPMVVMPHGGPHGPYDRWGFDPDVQLLASNGYAVLQVNFRGSGGYGTDFEDSGHRKWGREMQDDVTDATLWAVNEGIAARDRICISGGSYGGYATLEGVVREPDLYQCAIPIAGVYSLPMMWKRGDFRMNPSAAKVFLSEYLGDDEADLEARSPAYNVDRIKASLFIVHGSEDVRVPLTQAEFLRDRLDEAGKDYEWMVRKEGHGFTQVKNREDMYEAMLAFLDRNIGEGRKAAGVKTAAN